MEAALASMRRHREGWLGRVRIGASTTALIYHLPPVLRSLRREHPDIDLLVTTGTTTRVVERLLHNDVDVGIVSLPISERLVEVIPLVKEHLVAIFPATVGELPAEISPADLVQHPLILELAQAHVKTTILEWLAAAEFEVRPAMELDNLEAVKRMVAAGLGASIVPASVVGDAESDGHVTVRPLRPPISRALAYVQRKDKQDDPAIRHVRAAFLTLRQPG
jgi:DNA-binding transcriptional LysR family regulator